MRPTYKLEKVSYHTLPKPTRLEYMENHKLPVDCYNYFQLTNLDDDNADSVYFALTVCACYHTIRMTANSKLPTRNVNLLVGKYLLNHKEYLS